MRRAMWPLLGGVLLATVSPAQEPFAPEGAVEELIQEERYRSAVENAIEYAHQRGISGAQRVDVALEAVGDLLEAGNGVVPYLANVLDQVDPETFFFGAFALAHFRTEAAEAALRRALDRASQQGTDFANIRKAWCGYDLGFMGVVEALDLVNEGGHAAGRFQIHGKMSVTEAVALLNAPESIPLLLKQLDEYAKIDALWKSRVFTIRALGLIGERSTVPRLIALLQEERTEQYPEALEALGRIGDPRAVPAVISALDSPDERISNAAANALGWLSPADRLQWAVDRLDSETNTWARLALYKMVLSIGGAAQLETLQKHWGRPYHTDREFLILAVAGLKSPKAMGLLQAGVNDENDRVAYRAIVGLADLGTAEAIELLHKVLRSRSLTRSRAALAELIRIEDRSSAPIIAERLVAIELAENVVSARRRERAELMADALVSLRYSQVLPELVEALKIQKDMPLRQHLESVIAQLELLKKNGKKLTSWVEAMNSPELSVRRMAYRRLGEIGGEAAAAALASRFGRLDPEEGVELLRSLGEIDSPSAVALIKRVLLEPAFDRSEMLPLRDMAAWGARRIGGTAMYEALKAAIERREGRDARVMIYLAVMGGSEALPILARYRVPRLRFLNYYAGRELEDLDWIVRQFELARTIDKFDVPPKRIVF
jgi:HEAT repeat protein